MVLVGFCLYLYRWFARVWESAFVWPSSAFCVSPIMSQSPRQLFIKQNNCVEKISWWAQIVWHLVKIKWSKTIQLAERTIHILVLAIPNSPICPVKAYWQMVDKIPSSSDDPAFCVPSKEGNQPMTYHLFQSLHERLVLKFGWLAQRTGPVMHIWPTCHSPWAENPGGDPAQQSSSQASGEVG